MRTKRGLSSACFKRTHSHPRTDQGNSSDSGDSSEDSDDDEEEAGVVSTFCGHTLPVLSVAYSNDGKMCASGSRDTTVQVHVAVVRAITYSYAGLEGPSSMEGPSPIEGPSRPA